MTPDEPFRLVNEKPATKRFQFETSDRTRQKVLFSGLDCLAGQFDLFDTDSLHNQLNNGDQRDDQRSDGRSR